MKLSEKISEILDEIGYNSNMIKICHHNIQVYKQLTANYNTDESTQIDNERKHISALKNKNTELWNQYKQLITNEYERINR